MCIQHILISGRRLLEVRQDPELPDLTVEEIPSDSERAEAVRRVAAAPFLYSVGPSEVCGCYFTCNRAEHEVGVAGADGDPPLSGEDLRVDEWIWRQGYNSVNSFARHLARHVAATDQALYVCWEHLEGTPIEQRQTVAPTFSGGRASELLPENALFAIVSEPPEPTLPAQ